MPVNCPNNCHNSVDSSLRSILRVSVPLILSSLSWAVLFLSDRLILAYYSVDAMNAAAISGNLLCVFSFIFTGIAGVADVYVGQYNGAKDYKNLSAPTWQMLYLACCSFVLLAIIAYFAEYINLLPAYYFKDGVEYQRILTYYTFLPCMNVAFAAFFIGQGKTKIITISFITANLVNIILDILLVFGYKDIIPSMGCVGAAIATVIAEAVRTLVLASVFFNKVNRSIYNTAKNFKFKKDIFFGCIRIGAPLSIGRVLDMGAWYIIYAAISNVSKDLATIHGITVSVHVFSAFICDGLNKSSATVSANLIGQRNLEKIRIALRIFCKIALIFCAIIAVPLVIYPECIFCILDLLHDDISAFYSVMRIIFALSLVSIIMDSISSSVWGILLSGGDTKYPIVVNICALWLIVVLPICLLYFMGMLTSATTMYWLSIVWSGVTLWLLYRRYKSLKWYKRLI